MDAVLDARLLEEAWHLRLKNKKPDLQPEDRAPEITIKLFKTEIYYGPAAISASLIREGLIESLVEAGILAHGRWLLAVGELTLVRAINQ
jgi:hypothetical protein